jgi:hypothetical protein
VRRLGERRIEQRDPRRRRRIPARHLHVRGRVGDDGVALRLAAGPGRRRHENHGQQRRASPPVAAVVAHRAAVGQEEVDPLGAVERAAAAEADDRVRLEARGVSAARFHHRAVGVLAELVEGDDRDVRVLEQPARRRHVAGIDEAGVGDEQRAAESEIGGQMTEPRERALTEDDARARPEVEGLHLK